MEPFYIEDCSKIPINSKGWYLQGFSRAGDRTGFVLHPQKFLFDCGVRTNQTCKNVFMTHVHTDHSLELPSICNRHKLSDSDQPFQIYAPSSSIKHLSLLFRAVAQLSFPDSEFQTEEQILGRAKADFHGVNAGDRFLVGNIKASSEIQYEMDIFPSYHTVQCVGYGLASLKRKLKAEYLAIMTDESIDKRERVKQLEDLKRDPQIELYTITRTPEIVFFCDSSIRNLAGHEGWKVYPTIVCECTGLFLDQQKKSEEEYLRIGHTCLSQLLPIIRLHKEKKWILIHVSTGIRREEIERVEKHLREEESLDITIYH